MYYLLNKEEYERDIESDPNILDDITESYE